MNLFDDLLEDGIYACGTFRRDRKGVPQAIKDVKLGKSHLFKYVPGAMFHVVPTCNCSVHTQMHVQYRCIHTILVLFAVAYNNSNQSFYRLIPCYRELAFKNFGYKELAYKNFGC